MSLGRRFGQSRTVYDSHRRYLEMNDPLRNKRQAHSQGYEYVTDERRQLGDFKHYESYQKNGVKAIALNKAEYNRRIKREKVQIFLVLMLMVFMVSGAWTFYHMPLTLIGL